MAFGTDTRAIQFELRGRDAGAEAALSRTDRAMGKLNASYGTLSRFIGAGAVLAGAQQIFSATIQAERASAKLEATLRATGHAAGITRAELDQMANRLADQTTFDDDELRAGLGTLLRFRDVQRDVFRDAAELGPNLAVAMGTNLSSAYQKLGQALQDPVRGTTQLREAGINIIGVEAEVRRVMAETGDVVKAQRVIVDDLRRSVGGVAGEETQGLYGATRALTKAWDDLVEALGKTSTVSGSGGFFRGLADLLSGAAKAIEKGEVLGSLAAFATGGAYIPAPTPAAGGSGDARGRAAQGAASRDEARAAEAAAAKREEQIKRALAHEKKLEDLRRSALEGLERQRRTVEDLTEVEKVLADIESGRYGAASQAFKDQAIALAAAIDLAKEDKEVREQAAAAEARYYETVKQRGEEEAEKRARELEETKSRLENVILALMTEEEAERESFERRHEILYESLELRLITEEEFDRLREEAKQRHEENITRIEDAQTRRRFGISKVYRNLDLDSAKGFFGQMAVLMESSSRSMFEIGKASAIAETIISTYEGAQAAFTSLAKIPIIGPALGAAAAAAAIVAGFARVQQIRAVSFKGGGAAGGGTGVFPVNPNTGLPAPSQFPNQQQATAGIERITHVHVHTSSKLSRDALEELADGLREITEDGFPAIFSVEPT